MCVFTDCHIFGAVILENKRQELQEMAMERGRGSVTEVIASFRRLHRKITWRSIDTQSSCYLSNIGRVLTEI